MTERPMNLPERTKNLEKMKNEKVKYINKKNEETKQDKKINTEKKIEEIIKKNEAVVNGKDIKISLKHAVAVCKFIKNKSIEEAINKLEEVKKMKIAVPMKGEIPHRKGMMSGRYPINAVKEFLILLKSLKANAINNELELEKLKLASMANVASRPIKRLGKGYHKRAHVQIKLIPIETKQDEK